MYQRRMTSSSKGVNWRKDTRRRRSNFIAYLQARALVAQIAYLCVSMIKGIDGSEYGVWFPRVLFLQCLRAGKDVEAKRVDFVQ